MGITLTSTAFEDGQPIPQKFTCQGANTSPPLKWTAAPAGTKSLVLICDDPDAPVGTWVHWVLYELPAAATELAEAVPANETLQNGARHGVNDFRKIGYGGPCPPPGGRHRYFFKLYAIDAHVPLKAGAAKEDVLRAIQHHVLAEGRLVGTYQRR